MKKQKNKKKLRVQLALYYLTTSMVTLLLMGFILFHTISSIFLSNALSATEMAVEKSGTYLESYIDKLKTISDLLAENPQLINYFSDTPTSAIIEQDIIKSIHTTLISDPFIQSVIMVSKDGKIISNEKGLDMSMSNDMMKEEWYVSAINNDQIPVLTSARMQKFSMDKESWVISISREIKDYADHTIGVLLIDIKYQVVEDYLSNIDLGQSGFAFIINDNSEIVYHKDTIYFENPQKKEELLDIISKKSGYNSQNNTLTHAYRLKNADWTLVGIASQDSLLILKKQLLEIFITVGIILLIIVAGSTVIFTGKLVSPIQKLESAMQEFEDRLLKVKIDKNGCYEIESLSNHFNTMVDKINHLMIEISEKEKHLRVYEIGALYSQINPHFLYNTLDTIVWMAEFNNSQKVIEITKALAQFFRLSLSGGNELTSVENELDHVRKYLFIQKERYGESLNYSIIAEDSILTVQIPKILLQPIVENAIYHGIKGLDKPGYIEISAYQDKNLLVLTVKDNGIGFNLKDIDEKIPNQTTKLGGIGLENVDKRIKLYYGEKYGLIINSLIGQGTNVLIKIPLELQS